MEDQYSLDFLGGGGGSQEKMAGFVKDAGECWFKAVADHDVEKETADLMTYVSSDEWV